MLKHIVMWRFVEGAEGKSRKENAQWMKEHLEALVGVVPEIRSMEVGVNCYPGETAYDAVLISTFDDVNAMNRYKVHPAHVAVAEYCKKVRESRVDIDYEI
ncbi:MAG: Dabb family protein [Bacteroidaceae bacterium]|nr:Dabb family protein [Bacteroidaceae bacterium]